MAHKTLSKQLREFFEVTGRIGGRVRWRGVSEKEKSAFGRRAARIRWDRYKRRGE